VPDLKPDDALIQERLHQLVGEWSHGRTSLKEIIGLGDDELYAIANQGYYLFVQGKNEPARTLFEGLVALDPRNAYYYRALGAIYWRIKEPQLAIRQFTYAIRVSPREITSYINRAEVYVAQKQFKLARSDLQFALSTASPSDRALAKKARAMLRMIAA
jgi:tetratricopeptide (TPR) repeat protein